MKKLFIVLLLVKFCHYSFGQSSYYPLKKGETLTYAYGKELYQGQNIDVSQRRMTVKILDEPQAINGKDYFVVETTSNGVATDVKSYLRVGGDGAILGIQEGETQESIIMKKSPAVGDTWVTNRGGIQSTSSILELDGTIKTPAKTFENCLVLESVQNGSTTKGYFQRGLGMVAITMIVGDLEKLFIYMVNE